MDFIGIWKKQETEELIEISNGAGADSYLLNYNNEFKTCDNIEIFNSYF